MSEVAVIGNYDIRDKKLADASTNTSVASTDAVLLKDTNGNYVEIDRDSFTDAVRSALGPILTNMTQKTAASGGVMVNDSNDVGTMNLSNLASLLGVLTRYSTTALTANDIDNMHDGVCFSWDIAGEGGLVIAVSARPNYVSVQVKFHPNNVKFRIKWTSTTWSSWTVIYKTA